MNDGNANNIINNFKKDKIILLCLSFLVLAIHIRYIGSIGIFTVLDDEFGYWGTAAYLAGFDWSDAVSKIPYYSYGYSLLLVPLFWIFDNPLHIYKAAIFLNGIMISVSFLLCYDIARKLAKGTNSYILMGIAFLISMYPTYIAYSSIAWSECLLIFVCWLLTWCFVGLNKESSSYKFWLIGFLSIYVYVIHQRALGILFASIAVIIIMKLLNKINMKQLLIVVFPIILLFIVHFYMKDYIQSNVWLNASGNLTNDYSAQASKISQIFTIDGFWRFIKVFLGQFFYIGAASYLLSYFGMYEMIQKIGLSLKNFWHTKKANIFNYDFYFYPYLFLLLAVLASLAISVISMINPTRIDHIVYGRYIEMILGPIILIGLLKLLKKEIHLNKLLPILICFSFLTVAVFFIIKSSGLLAPHLMQAVGILLMLTPLNVFLPAFIAIYSSILIFRSFSKNNKQILISIFVVFCLFFITGDKITRTTTNNNRNIIEISKTVDFINNYESNLPVYFLLIPDNPAFGKWDNRNTSKRLIADCYQFLLKDKPMKLVNKTSLETIEENKFVLLNESKNLPDLLEDYEICITNNYGYLLVSKPEK